MADAPTPNPTPAAPPVAPPVAPDIQAPTDTSAIMAPAASAPDRATAVQNTVMPYEQEAMAATQRATEAAKQPVVDPKVPHAKLLAMIQAIGIGLSSFGAAATTGGREGGAPMVQTFYGQQQEQEMQAHQARVDNKNTYIQQQMTIADTNHKLAQSIIMMSTLPTNLAMNDLELTEKQQKVAAGKQAFVQTEAEFTGAHGIGTDAYGRIMGGQGTSADTGNFGAFNARKVEAAAKILGEDDPSVVNARQLLADPKASPRDVVNAIAGVNQQMGLQQQVSKAQETGPFGDRAAAINAALLSRYQVLNPTAKTLPPGFNVSADSTPKDFDRVDKMMQQTENAQATKANRDEVNAMRQQTMALSGMGAPAGDTKLTGDAYLQSLPGPEQANVRALGTGKMAIDRMSYLLARNPKLTTEVNLAFPDFDSSKIQSYVTAYKDFTSGKTSIALNAGGTALGHLHELQQLNTAASHIPHSSAWTAYQNKAATVSTELAKFYGDATIPAIQKIEETLTSTLPGNRQAAITTQAQSMGDKLDSYKQQWKEAAPSAAYEARMPDISPQAKAARAALDPGYAASQQPAAAESGKSVSLAAAMALPINKGKTADQVRADITSHGHQVTE